MKNPFKEVGEACARKRRYTDEVSARAMGSFLIENNGNVPRLFTYKCPFCSGWHLTKKTNGVAIERDNPVAERSPDDQVLSVVKGGPVTTYLSEQREYAWVHQTMLRLEACGKVARLSENETTVRWAAA